MTGAPMTKPSTASPTTALTAAPSTGPLAHYERALNDETISQDSAQRRAVESLQRVFDSATQPAKKRLFTRRKTAPAKGLYMYGGVGRGKTMLMDFLAEDLPESTVYRAHFHHFMADTHAAIKKHKGAADPLEPVAAELAARARVLCFDEFFVSDVADAMILGRLVTKLFERGLVLVSTSNIAPADLYHGGLQRERFIPAISALEKHCEILNVDGGVDYRLRELQRAHTYHHPLGETANRALAESFHNLSPETAIESAQLQILGRNISCIALGHDVAWFRYAELCEGPRSATDYIEIAREYSTVLLSDIPQMDQFCENEARRFLHLIDEFYDRRVKLIISAAVPINQLYAGNRLAFEFARAMSRLEEMQSEEYLAEPHQPI